MNKLALHSYDRGMERLNLDPKSIDAIQRKVDAMWYVGGYKKLKKDRYHVKIRDPYTNLLGYAMFKQVNKEGAKPRLILSTIYDKTMKPRCDDISNFVHTNIKDNMVKLDLPEKFKQLPAIPNNVDKN
jgi:hypothetical protein